MRPNFLEKVSMSAVAIAERLVGEEMLAKKIKRPEARKVIAHEADITAGSLESLARGRLKFLDRIEGKLNALFIRKLEQRMQALQHELEVAKAMAARDQVDIERAEAALEELREALGK